jgi:hypothetical protein
MTRTLSRATYLVWTSDDAGKPPLSLSLTFDHGLEDTGMIRAQVEEAVSYTSLPDDLEKGAKDAVCILTILFLSTDVDA